MTRLLTSLILIVGVVANAAAVNKPNGVRCALNVHQWDTERSAQVLLWADTADFLKDKRVSGFAVGLSIDVNVTSFDTVSARFDVHAYTFAQQPTHGAKNFQVEYGLPARIDSLIGKNGARLSLTVMPLEPVWIDTAFCTYSQHVVEDFSVDPTAHMNIYYVPQTLGDFYWNSVKGLLEDEYDNLSRMVNFNMPGKYILYLCPCKLNTVIWDDRFAMMIDPVRSTIFAVYAKDYNSVFPFLINQAAVYHNYGYAPAFLADGFANYSSFAIYDMKKMKAEGHLIPLDSLLNTHAYYQTDPNLSDRMSATFVKYLIDQYRIGLFMELYRKSDDLKLRAQIEETYGKKIKDLEAEWLNYVDTVSITFEQAGYHASIAETRLDYAGTYQYAREMFRLANNRNDSLEALGLLSRSAFFVGDYYAATDEQLKLLGLADTVAGEWMKLAGYRMMNGEYEQADSALGRAYSLDSTNSLVRFNQAMLRQFTGDTLGARRLYTSVIQSGAPSGGMIEGQVMLANLLMTSGKEADKSEALGYYNSVVGALSRQDRQHNPSVSQAMWLGIAYLGTGDTGNAEDYLQTALFLETRPFYQGMILLWLGKVADVRGERRIARDYYQKVLAGTSAHYHQEEARRLIERPYRR
ncbi:MAG: hypothetical protein NTW07_07450 [candidate division Zixibacteria bacterium]|nr:hypothetical protein [candidate division Zixibacteria bacterium]